MQEFEGKRIKRERKINKEERNRQTLKQKEIGKHRERKRKEGENVGKKRER